MYSHTTTRPFPDPTPVRWNRLSRGRVGLVVAAVFAVALVARVTALPPAVDHVTIVNPTAYDLDVGVAGAAANDWLALGVVSKGSTMVVHDVIDTGETWVFRIRGQAQSGGDVRVSRAQLVAGHWQVEIPADVGQRLSTAGAPPSP